MSFGKFLDPRNDFAFKQIFGTEKNQDILIHFLNDMLCTGNRPKIGAVTFLKTNQGPEIAAKKQSAVDVLCQDESGVKYIVEMQVAKSKGFEEHTQYYAAKTYCSQLNAGQQYEELKEVIFLAITDYIMFPDKKTYKSDHVLCDKETQEQDLKDFSFTFLELPKFNKRLGSLKTPIEKWTYFLKHASETSEVELAEIVERDVFLGRAYEALNRFSWTEKELNTYEAAEKQARDAEAILAAAKEAGIALGEARGIEIGESRGIAQEKLNIAKNLLAQGVSVEVIIATTGLSRAVIETLIS